MRGISDVLLSEVWMGLPRQSVMVLPGLDARLCRGECRPLHFRRDCACDGRGVNRGSACAGQARGNPVRYLGRGHVCRSTQGVQLHMHGL